MGGFVTKHEFIVACKKVEQILPYCGVDKGFQQAFGIDRVAGIVFEFETTGPVNFENFLAGVLKYRRAFGSEPPPLLPWEKVIEMAWQVIDTDSNGIVSIDEVNEI